MTIEFDSRSQFFFKDSMSIISISIFVSLCVVASLIVVLFKCACCRHKKKSAKLVVNDDGRIGSSFENIVDETSLPAPRLLPRMDDGAKSYCRGAQINTTGLKKEEISPSTPKGSPDFPSALIHASKLSNDENIEFTPSPNNTPPSTGHYLTLGLEPQQNLFYLDVDGMTAQPTTDDSVPARSPKAKSVSKNRLAPSRKMPAADVIKYAYPKIPVNVGRAPVTRPVDEQRPTIKVEIPEVASKSKAPSIPSFRAPSQQLSPPRTPPAYVNGSSMKKRQKDASRMSDSTSVGANASMTTFPRST